MERFIYKLPNRKEYISSARLTASAIANAAGFNFEDVEDIRLAVGEACNNAVIHSNRSSHIELEFILGGEDMEILVRDSGNGFNPDDIKQPHIEEYDGSGLGIFIIESLMDSFKIISGNGEGTTISMKKNL